MIWDIRDIICLNETCISQKDNIRNNCGFKSWRVRLKNRLTSIGIVCLLICAGFLGFIPFESKLVSAYTIRNPIFINGNGNFTPANGVVGGTGTSTDPYIIEGWEISDEYDYGIEIRNTDAYFVIRDVFLHGPNQEDGGIRFDMVVNGTIESSVISNYNKLGIGFWDCREIRLESNTVIDTGTGIYLIKSENITLISNNIRYQQAGVILSTCINISLYDNVFWETGIEIRGYEVFNFNSHKIPTNNTVNYEPVYYHKDLTNLKIDNISVGQLLLVNCTNVAVTNITISYTGPGILSAFTNNVSFVSNKLEGNIWGIYVHFSKNNSVTSCNFTGNEYGISLRGSPNCTFINNKFYSNGCGINIYFHCNDTKIISNDFVDHWDGIHIQDSNRTTILQNNILNNHHGIAGHGMDNLLIKSNDISYNLVQGVSIGTRTSDGMIIQNKISHNKIGLRFWGPKNQMIINNNISYNSNGVFIFTNITTNITLMSNNIYGNTLYGVNISQSNGNFIYHNNFFDNYIQAYDSTGSNNWDDGYPSGGNYWSDYNGSDNFKGPGQNILGSDGIGDTPYKNIAGGAAAWDNYPLLYPIGNYIFLYEGWNLVSIPFIQSDTNLGIVLSSISGWFSAVQWYNSTDFNDHWKHNSTKKPSQLNDLNDIDHKMGFWIYITKPGGVLSEYFGIQPSKNQTINLYPGWNLVGYPSLKSYNRTKGLKNLTFGSDIDSIWTFNAATQKWEEINETDYFMIGRGYWIHSKVTKTWDVPL